MGICAKSVEFQRVGDGWQGFISLCRSSSFFSLGAVMTSEFFKVERMSQKMSESHLPAKKRLLWRFPECWGAVKKKLSKTF